MSPELWTTLLAALIGGALAVFIKGMFDRPKTSADARSTNVTAEVSLSADSREWVSQAMGRAKAAEERSDRAEKRLDETNEKVERLEDENDELRLKFNLLLDYVMLMHRDWPADTHKPPPPPKMLRLEPHVRTDAPPST